MDNRPIAIFDSGLGGLTALRALRELLPGENLIFFGDSARAPYGGRTRQEIIDISLQDLRFVTGFDVKAVLVGCGTSSSNAMEQLRLASPVPVMGVIESAARTAARLAPCGRIGVIATEATVRSGAYAAAIREFAPGAQVTERACPAFVPLVEAGRFGIGDAETCAEVEKALEPFVQNKTQVLLLGCTHYPLLKDEIRSVLPGAQLVSNSRAAAEDLAAQLSQRGLAADAGRRGSFRIFTSGDAQSFARSAQPFLGMPLEGLVEHVKL